MSEVITGLVRAVCGGDTEALAKLYTMTLKPSYYLALKLCSDKDEAVEITKKAYAKAFCTITKLKKPEAFEIWIRQNITTAYKDSRDFVFDDAVSGITETSKEFLSQDVYSDPGKAAAALAAVDSLKTELRMVTVLHYYVNMPVASIAKLLGVSESTVNALLVRAKGVIYEASGSSRPEAAPVSSVPVLSALMQEEMKSTEINNADVRDMFIYIQDIFDSFKRTDKFKAAAEAKAASGAYFKADPSIPSRPAGYQPPEPEEEDRVDFDRFTDEQPSAPVRSVAAGIIAKILNTRIGGKKIKDYNLRLIGVIAAAVLLSLIIIIAVGKHNGKKNKPAADPVQTTESTFVQVNEKDYKWIAGGFENFQDIVYLDENAAMFKLVGSPTYGLIDYQGNVLLQPVYEGFKRCSQGREYEKVNVSEKRSAYHTLYTKDGTDYYVYYESGVAVPSDNPHIGHGYNSSLLDSDIKYDERDRYYEGYAAAEKDGKWGYISLETDKKVIPYEYEPVNVLAKTSDYASCDYCRPVTGGLVAVKKDGYMGIINLKNNVIVPFEFTDILVGSDGVFIARKDGEWGVILVGDAINTFKGVNPQINTTGADDPAVNEENAKTYICVADSGINVRSDAGADFQKIGELASGDEVTGYGTKTAADTGKEWLKIKYGESYGYVAMSYMQVKN